MWIIFALLSTALYTATNFVDKYLISRRVKDYNALPIYTAFVSSIFGFIWWAASGFPLLPFNDAFIILTTGIITIFSIVLYFKALSVQETSMVILLFQISPLFTLFLSSIFLRETISINQYIGFTIVLIANTVLALPKKSGRWQMPRGFWLILLYDFMFALVAILLKFSTSKSSFTQILSYESFGMGIGGLLIFCFIPKIRMAFLLSRKKILKNALSAVVLNEILFIIAKSLGYYAYILGSVTLVSTLLNTQVFIGLLFGWILSMSFPKVFNEDISFKALIQKSWTAFLLFIGLCFML